MSIFNDKALKGVAEAAAKIMAETSHGLKGNQHKIDANKNGKIDAHDFKLLRAKKKPMNEELEQLNEAKKPMSQKEKDKVVGAVTTAMRQSYANVMQGRNERAAARMNAKIKSKHNVKEEAELDEAFPTVADAKKRMDAGKTEHGSVTKTASGLVHKRDYKDDNDEDDAPKKKTPYGARQKRNLGTKLYKESFADMISSIQTNGAKSLSNIFEKEQINEEPDNEQFTKELKDQEASMSGKKKQPSVAAPATQGVKNMAESEDVQQEGIMDVAKGAAGVVKKVISNEKAYQAQKQKKAGEVMSNLRKEESEELEQIDEKEGYGESDPLKNRERFAAANKPGQVYKKTHPGNIGGMSKKYAYDIKRTGPKKKLPEEVELDERELTKGEAEKKEDYVMGMKKKLSGFKQRYGDRAKEVMYATATRMAKED